MKKVFVINGLPGTGKSLFGQLVCEELSVRRVDFLHTSSIDLVKHVLLSRYQWDERVVPTKLWATLSELKDRVTGFDWDGQTKDIYWRGVMSRLKSAITLAEPDLINQWVWSRVLSVGENGWVFVDIREPENIRSFSDYCHRQRVGVPVRTVCVLGDIHAEFDNPSDARVGEYPYDIYITNNRREYGEDVEVTRRQLQKTVGIFVERELGSGARGLERE